VCAAAKYDFISNLRPQSNRAEESFDADGWIKGSIHVICSAIIYSACKS
jgi:hypothetical protein